jgi:hypothetical protein
MLKIVAALLVVVFLSGCATSQEVVRGFLGVSTKDLEDCRKDAAVGIMNCGYDECYGKVAKTISILPKAYIYAKSGDMIAFYYVNPNTTPVGVFFKAQDPSHTQVEVSCQDSGFKEKILNIVITGKLPPKESDQTLFKK